jgi:hypothetical protein
MVRQLIPYLNASADGYGMEGFLNYTNKLTDFAFLPIFMLVFYFLGIYVWSKSEWKLGGGIAFISLIFFMLSWIAQIFTTMNQLVIFIFFIGIIVGIVMSTIENAK